MFPVVLQAEITSRVRAGYTPDVRALARAGFVRTMPVGGLTTDVKIAGRWGIVAGQSTNSVLNQGVVTPRI